MPPEEVVTIETLLARIAKETDPSAYRGHIVEFSRFLSRNAPIGRSNTRCRR